MMTPAHLVMKTAMMKPHAVARDFEVAHLHHLNSSVALNIFHFSFYHFSMTMLLQIGVGRLFGAE